MGASKRLCELVVQSFDKMIKNHREGDIPVLHVHQEDEDRSMYPLAEGTQRHDENGKDIFTFPGQDDKGHRKAQTEYSLVRFGVGEIIGQTALRPQKYLISSNWCTPFVLFKNYFYSNSIEEKHGLSIPCINPIISKIILVSTKMLLKYLRFARALGNLIQLKYRGLSVLIGASKYSPYFDDGLLPTLI
jgi:hypothetical protein